MKSSACEYLVRPMSRPKLGRPLAQDEERKAAGRASLALFFLNLIIKLELNQVSAAKFEAAEYDAFARRMKRSGGKSSPGHSPDQSPQKPRKSPPTTTSLHLERIPTTGSSDAGASVPHRHTGRVL